MSELQDYLNKNLSAVNFSDNIEVLNINIADIIVNARKEANMTQKELSEKTGIQQATISKIENGTINPSVSMLERIAYGLNKKLIIKFE